MCAPWSDAESSLAAWVDDPRGRFHEWRQPRPLLGAGLLVAAGLAIAYVPLQFTAELMLLGGAYTVIGILFSALVAFCGLAALAKPELSSVFGVFGAALATLSIFGALGGLFLGTILGTVGGVLCYAWEPPAGFEYDETTLAEASEFVWQETGGFVWQRSSGFTWQTEDKGTDAATEDPTLGEFADDVEAAEESDPEPVEESGFEF